MNLIKRSLRNFLLKSAGLDYNMVDNEKGVVYNFTNVEIQDGCIISPDSEIGEYTYIGAYSSVTKSSIGRFCSIATNVSVGNGEHDLKQVSTSSLFYKDAYNELTKSTCSIGNDVWIGTQCVIRRGVTIGNGAVVGANSFVNKDVPDFAIVVGTPAKIVKYRFSDHEQTIINSSQWWEMNIEEAELEISKLKLLIK